MKRYWLSALAILVLAWCGLVFPAGGWAASHALLIGVGEYPQLGPSVQLEGPSHDVEAMVKVLKSSWGLEGSRITVLKDRRATRANILQALKDLSRTTRPGDFVFIFFSGHGTSAYDPSSRTLGIDAFTGAQIPSDFRHGTRNQVLGRLLIGKRDIRPILERLERDRKILVVFDSCYSGDAVRSLRIRPGPRPVKKFIALGELTGGDPIAHGAGTIKEPPYPYRNVVYISAASRREQAEDIPMAMVQSGYRTVDGRPHGALSNALLAGLSGSADTNQDDRISYSELYQYVRTMVTARHPHTPQILYSQRNRSVVDRPIFDRSIIRKKRIALTHPGRSLKVKLEGIESHLAGRIRRLNLVEVVNEGYDLVLSKTQGQYGLYLANGHLLVSYPQSQADRAVDRIASQIAIKELAGLSFPGQRFNVFVELLGRKGVLVEGETVGFRLRAGAESYILLIDIDPTGVINVIYPGDAGEMNPVSANRELSLPDIGQVVPAFGTDFVKAFAFRNRPAGLERIMGQSFGPDAPLFSTLMNLIRRAGGDVAQATIQVKTAPRSDLQ